MSSPQSRSDAHAVAHRVKQAAHSLGFDACGIASVGEVDAEAVTRYRMWLSRGGHGCMAWAARHSEVRDNPALLLEGARSLIMVAMNYYPSVRQHPSAPQFAYYAYGRDYHEVLKERLRELAATVTSLAGGTSRACVDSAPLRERFWAQQAGLGFVGRNNQLILPGRGSYFFLGALLTTAELPCDAPCEEQCSGCGACERACPAGALRGGAAVDAGRCLSCLTIEHRGELPEWVGKVIGNRVYGCDECQRCCPHNAHATPTTVAELAPSQEFLGLTLDKILAMTPADFSRVFSHSAVKRTKLEGLKRNAALVKAGLTKAPK